jgi:hypothetical protein
MEAAGATLKIVEKTSADPTLPSAHRVTIGIQDGVGGGDAAGATRNQGRRASRVIKAGVRLRPQNGQSGRSEGQHMANVHDETVKAAEHVADTLQQRGHATQAHAVRAVLGHSHAGSLLLAALRDVCQVVLTAIEAIDPVSATMVEELRLEVDKRLNEGHRPGPGC